MPYQRIIRKIKFQQLKFYWIHIIYFRRVVKDMKLLFEQLVQIKNYFLKFWEHPQFVIQRAEYWFSSRANRIRKGLTSS